MQISRLKRQSSACLLTRHRHFTPLPVSHWVTEQGARLRTVLTGDITFIVWPYRRAGQEYLMCDGFDACQTVTLMLRTGGPHDFRGRSPVVPDMTEALHMVGMLATVLDARVKLDCRGEGKALRFRERTA